MSQDIIRAVREITAPVAKGKSTQYVSLANLRAKLEKGFGLKFSPNSEGLKELREILTEAGYYVPDCDADGDTIHVQSQVVAKHVLGPDLSSWIPEHFAPEKESFVKFQDICDVMRKEIGVARFNLLYSERGTELAKALQYQHFYTSQVDDASALMGWKPKKRPAVTGVNVAVRDIVRENHPVSMDYHEIIAMIENKNKLNPNFLAVPAGANLQRSVIDACQASLTQGYFNRVGDGRYQWNSERHPVSPKTEAKEKPMPTATRPVASEAMAEVRETSIRNEIRALKQEQAETNAELRKAVAALNQLVDHLTNPAE